MGGILKYAVEIDLGAMICMPSLIKIGSGFQKLKRGESQTHTDSIEIAWACFRKAR
jgi:hypothetical protein